MYKTIILSVFLLKISASFYIPLSPNDVVEDKQHAVCNITTKDIQATANASITRQLKGVCTSNELKLLFEDFKKEIIHELNDIKVSLNIKTLEKSEQQNNQINFIEYIDEETNRNEEISLYNNTIQKNLKDGNVFFYYWKIENIDNVLQRKNMYLYSPNFQIFGHNLQLQLHPQHTNANSFGIQLRPDSASFLKQHKIVVLDQINQENDIISPLIDYLHDTNGMYKILTSTIETGNYKLDNNLVIKLILYLDS